MNASVFSAVFLLLSFASSAVYASPADEAPDPPDVPKLNTQPWVPARYRAVRENLLGKECGILFVGDSITGRCRAVEEAVSADEGGQLRSERGQDGQHAVAYGGYETGGQDFPPLLRFTGRDE